MRTQATCRLAEEFSVWEKLYAQLSFTTMGIVGTVGIVRADWPWLLPYLVVYWYGVPGIVMRHLSCPRCPHLHTYRDCLQCPPKLTKWLVKRRKATPFSRTETWGFYFIFLFIPTYPIYWLVSQPVLLTAFVLAASMWYVGQFARFCRRCRNEVCPFNRSTVLQ